MARRDAEHTQLPIPNGWFAVAFSRDLIAGDVRAVHYFDEDLVLLRTRSGEARVLDAYCPHLGAHLGHGGRVMGETLRCPFHGWQFDAGTGACSTIPYCDRIPPAAHVRAWPTRECNGMIFAWHHDRGSEPEWDLPTLPEIGDAEWSEPRTFDIELAAHVQDTHENNNDPVHFQFVHGMSETPPSQTSYLSDGRVYRSTSQCEADIPGTGPLAYSLVRESFGLGLVVLRFEGIPSVGLTMFSSSTPIDATRTHSRWLLTSTLNIVDTWGEEFMKNLMEGVHDDFPIWRNKVHRAKPVLCEADGYLAEYRNWVKQFYSSPL
jgi:phenylpropionate dioxygenase-like ring-hydroxylating dioxygenase large terminal subunit